ncbi:hypothetical protein VSDG_02363 [Cytospora chrysosperma]|uniref:Uncharacterized protein n=1 Tax=Cytospora chrysosperma TaxID=252740 RepID=A0A423WFE4_CYTCH|nr:hypothetical protein VSDG_02363 [Valsa sordida]
MRAFQAALFSALAGLTLATNTTIRYFSTKEGCVDNYFQCSNIAIGHCCQISTPWCTYVDCPDCIANGVTAYSLPTHANNDCSGDPIEPVCASTSNNNICCSINHVEAPTVCSTKVSTNVGKKREEGEDCLGMVEPDTLVYTDAGGVKHEAHLPNGTFEQAAEFANIGDWNGLTEFLEKL